MRIGARLVDQERNNSTLMHVNRVGYVNKGSLKKKRYTRKVRRAPPPLPMALQELFVACREIFKGPGTVPPAEDVQKLSCILDNFKPEDVGLSRDLQFFQPRYATKVTPRVTYTTIYKCNNFELCIFFLPSGGVIPLHNHPEMTVFSKLLLGSMHVKSYDWVDPNDSGLPNNLRLAKIKADGVLTAPCSSSVLYPTTGGNLHAFTAITPCAILDVLGPPYSSDDGRDCFYYKDVPCEDAFPIGGLPSTNHEGGDKERYSWLQEIDMPENSQMDGIEYLGPPIIDTDH